MKANGSNELRVFHRFAHAEPVQFQFKDPNQFGGCLSRDLSEGGIRIRLNDFVPLETELMLKIRLADGNTVECSGRVVWIEKARFGEYYHAGLEFAGNESAKSLQKIIHSSLSRH